MDARERLRRYLEQRREAGESELVLDQMTVDEVMRTLGAKSAGDSEPRSGPVDWRASLRAVDQPVDAQEERPERLAAPPDAPRSVDLPLVKKDPADTARGSPETRQPAVATRRDQFLSDAEARSAVTAGPLGSESHATLPLERIPTGFVVGAAAHELFGGPGSAFATLDELTAAVTACTRCGLYRTAKNPVPGEGNPRADLVCVGEAPGAVEDDLGRPFVGPAGLLLDKILAAIKLSRNDVYICNVLKHRPPGNRNPMPGEVEACSPYLVRQIEIIRPKVIIAFGSIAAQTLLNAKDAIGKLRGRIHRYYGVPLLVTYHPAALLRNPGWKRPTWEDVQLARRLLDRAVSP